MSDDRRRLARIYSLIAAVGPGRTSSYGQIARLAGTNAPRQVARALSAAPAQMKLPWWRILRSDGSLAGHAGRAEQRRRLEREGVQFTSRGRVAEAHRNCPDALFFDLAGDGEAEDDGDDHASAS